MDRASVPSLPRAVSYSCLVVMEEEETLVSLGGSLRSPLTFLKDAYSFRMGDRKVMLASLIYCQVFDCGKAVDLGEPHFLCLVFLEL